MPVMATKGGCASPAAGRQDSGSAPLVKTPGHRLFLMSAGLLPTVMACMALAAMAWMEEGTPVPRSNWLAPALLVLSVASALGLWLVLVIEARLAASAGRATGEADAGSAMATPHGFRAQRREAVGQLSGSVAHELNNLLNVISINAELLGRLTTDSQAQVLLATTLRSVEDGRELTGHLLRLGEQHPPSLQTLDLAEALSRRRSLLETALGRQVTLEIEVSPDVLAVVADPADFELALVNLAFNAREAISAHVRPLRLRGSTLGQVHLLARPARAEDVEGKDIGLPAVLICMADDGIGLSDEALSERVFELGYCTQADRSGLGLSQVRAFCERASGRAWLRTTPGFGTAVSMVLPAASAGIQRGLAAKAGRRLASPRQGGRSVTELLRVPRGRLGLFAGRAAP